MKIIFNQMAVKLNIRRALEKIDATKCNDEERQYMLSQIAELDVIKDS